MRRRQHGARKLTTEQAESIERIAWKAVRSIPRYPAHIDRRDLAQEAITRIICRLPRRDTRIDFTLWAYLEARTAIIDFARKETGGRRRSVALWPGMRYTPWLPPDSLSRPVEGDETMTLADALADPFEDTADQAVDRVAIRRALRRLTPLERILILRAYVVGDAKQDLARTLGVTPGRVSQILRGAYIKMRQEVAT
jgi:RNA polymerase sigma factor (sigma-70 family)